MCSFLILAGVKSAPDARKARRLLKSDDAPFDDLAAACQQQLVALALDARPQRRACQRCAWRDALARSAAVRAALRAS